MSDEPTPDLDPNDGDGPSRAEPAPGPEPDETPSETHLRELLRVGAEGREGDPFSAIYIIRNRVHRRRIHRTLLAACTAAAVVAAGVLTVQARSGHSSRPVAAVPPPAPAYQLTGALVSFNACSDYLAYVKSQALAAVGPYGLDPDPGLTYRLGGVAIGAMGGAIGASTGSAIPPQAAAGAAGSTSAAAGSTSAAAGSPTFSTTNDQVAGVDEPDSVKTDGKIVVTLAGSTLRVLDLNARVTGSLALPGDTGGGLLLSGDRAVVLSSSPSSQPGTIGYVPSINAGDASVNGPAIGSQARATVVDLSDPAHPQLLRSYLFDGAVVAARLVDGQARLVLRSDPRISFVTPSSTGDNASATAANRQLIAASTIADWLPYWQIESPNGATTAREPLTSCQAVARPHQASGLSTVTVFTLDPSATAPGAGTSVVSAGETVYATAGQVYVAGPTGATADPYAGATPAGCCAILPPGGASTATLRTSMPASGAPVFEGAGTVPGWLIDSYAMDEDAQGDLRVATTSRSASGDTASQISVLRLTGGQLATIGLVGGLGSGEFIKTVRFIDDVAYVVTFQSFDPLYVVDLADPRRPALVGQLAQPGFSEFLYPISSRLLIGVGVQITDGEPSGLVVATYDVSDPAHPRRVDSSTLVTGYQYVAQGYDPHAFLYWPATDLALLAVPADGEYGTTGASAGIAAYRIGASGQLARTATLTHGSTSTTRSAVIDGRVWAFSDAGVLTAGLTNLAATTWQGY